MLYYMSRFLEGRELPAVADYLRDILKIKNDEETKHKANGLPINSPRGNFLQNTVPINRFTGIFRVGVKEGVQGMESVS